MHRLSEKRKQWLARHARRSIQHRLRRRRRTHTAANNSGRAEAIRLTIPETLTFEDNYAESVAFFDALRSAAEQRNAALTIDFTELRDIGPAAALVLATELECWRMSQLRRIRVVDIDKWDPFIRYLLNTLGLFALVNVANPPQPLADEHQRHFIQFQSHHLADGNHARKLRNELERITGEIPRWQDLYRALSEAMTNVRQHAYPREKGYERGDRKNRWWMSGAYNASDRMLTCVFYDRGVGIPATVEKTYGAPAIRELLQRFRWVESDQALIAAAMELGRTRTRLPHQGRGLADVEAFISRAGTGNLRILSRRGQYIYSGRRGKAKSLPLESPLRGTLIEWSIRLR
ncbi:MAG: hypothetical protein OXF33_07050 [Rhodospirillales bacterium]|nr:hypothetical protein [Rhodospirillales bacterium]